MHAKAIRPKVLKSLVNSDVVALETLSGMDSSVDSLIADVLDSNESFLTIDKG